MPSDEISFELLADVAALLLREGDHRTAGVRAYKLVNACSVVLWVVKETGGVRPPNKLNSRGRISLELVAKLAARLLQKDDYKPTAFRAYELLEAWAEHWEMEPLREKEIRRKAPPLFSPSYTTPRIVSALADPKFLKVNRDGTIEKPKPWEKAVKQITRKTTTKKAEKSFAKFWVEQIAEDVPAKNAGSAETVENATRRCAKDIKDFQRRGLNEAQIQHMRRGYQARPRHGPRK